MAKYGIILALSGCGTISGFVKENTNINGAQQLAAVDVAARQVDLPRLIFETSASSNNAARLGEACDSKTPDAAKARTCTEIATKAFYDDTSSDQKGRRNRIQARLLAASDAECAQFVQHLNSFQSYGNFTAGSLATIFSGAGAIVSNVNAARAFAGLGAIASGERAEFNADLFLQQAVPTIAKAITQQRRAVMDAILRSRNLSIDTYPLWDAIGDAFKYNDQCSLVHGIAALDRALQIAQDPGAKQMAQYLANFNRARAVAQNPNATDAGTSDTSIPQRSDADLLLPDAAPDSLLALNQRALESVRAGERSVAEAAQSSLRTDATCVEVAGNAAASAHCLRLAAEQSLTACKDTLLSAAYDLSTRQAIVSTLRSGSASPSQELLNANADRDRSSASARALGLWIELLRTTAINADTAAVASLAAAKPADAINALDAATKNVTKLDCGNLSSPPTNH